jgi:MerR family copper efflux transcriptional regulator
MKINELAGMTGLSDKTIRYYESVGVLPTPKRLNNGYRTYDENDIERISFVMGLRHLGFSLGDVTEILAMRDRGEAPCRVLLGLLSEKAEEVSGRIKELVRLEEELHNLHKIGLTYPTDDVDGKACVCHLVSRYAS